MNIHHNNPLNKKYTSEKCLRILYCATSYSKFPSREANSINQMRMCEAFANLGFKVTLLAPYFGKNIDEIFDFYGIKKCFDIKFIRGPKIKGQTYIHALSLFLKLFFTKADLVISRSALLCFLATLRGISCVFDTHGPIWEAEYIQQVSYKLIRKNKRIINMTTNSVALKKMFEERNLTPLCGIMVAHNGSQNKPHNIYPANWPRRKNSTQVGYFGHLYPGRGIDIVIECSKNLADCDFHVVGGNDIDVAYWKKKTPPPNVVFHGFIKPGELYKYRNICDILIAPYSESGVATTGGVGDTSRYMSPIKIIEYMSSKKPIIASNIPALKEILEHGRNAILCKADDVTDWVNSINRIRDDLRLGQKIAIAAYNEFLNDYTWEARAKIMMSNL